MAAMWGAVGAGAPQRSFPDAVNQVLRLALDPAPGQQAALLAGVGQTPLKLVEWLRDTFDLHREVVTSSLTLSALFKLLPDVVGGGMGPSWLVGTQPRAVQPQESTSLRPAPCRTNKAKPASTLSWEANCLLVAKELADAQAAADLWRRIGETSLTHIVVAILLQEPALPPGFKVLLP